jgi:hypothetical protein
MASRLAHAVSPIYADGGALRRLWIGPSLLANHDVRFLVCVDSKLDRRLAQIKLRAGSLV